MYIYICISPKGTMVVEKILFRKGVPTLALAGWWRGLGRGVGGLDGPRAGVDTLWRLCCVAVVGGAFAGGRLCVFLLLLQYLLQSCSRGGGGGVEDMCYERRRAEACVD